MIYSSSLQVTSIQPNHTGIEITVYGRQGILKIAPQSKVLIRHKVINTDELRLGDEILAYGFDNSSVK